MRNFLVACSVVGMSMVGTSAFALSVFSTGDPLLPAPGGAIDTHWQVAGPGVSTQQAVVLNYQGNPFPYSAYAANDSGSQWISYAADGVGGLTAAQNTGFFTYTTQVDFSGSTQVLSGHMWSDNALVDLTVGATSYFSSIGSPFVDGDTAWFTQGKNFSFSTNLTGVQTVTFTVRNGFSGYSSSPDPTAFRAHLQLDAVPEPFTMTLGLASAGLFVRRRLKSRRA